MKLGLLLLLAAAAFLWFDHGRKTRLKNRSDSTRQSSPRSAADSERIFACAHCGLHVPASDALVDLAGARYCCEAHRRLHSRA